MKYTIYEPHEIEIPDDKISELENMIRVEWGHDKDEEIYEEDLIHMAEEEGIVNLPDRWRYFD